MAPRTVLAKNFRQQPKQQTTPRTRRQQRSSERPSSIFTQIKTMKFSTALIGLFGLFAPSIKADGNLFDQDQDPSPITATAGLIEWDNSVEKEGSGHQGIIGGDHIERGSRPWLVPVRGRYFCGGSLISPSAVMTAGKIS
jgi:hypothetical protein